MKLVLNRRLEAKKENQSRTVLSAEDHMLYYGTWYYAAIRVATSIPKFQNREAISKKFNLPLATVISVLEFLVSRNLVEQKGDKFVHSQKQQVHLASDHSMIHRHHAN